MSEAIRDNDAKGIGPFIWASLEMERMFPEMNLQKDLTTEKVDPNKGIEF
jgi:hypothetical protein